MARRPPKLADTERLDQGIRRLELLSKLTWGFVEDHTNMLDQSELMVLLEFLDNIAGDLQVGHRALVTENNELHMAARATVATMAGGTR